MDRLATSWRAMVNHVIDNKAGLYGVCTKVWTSAAGLITVLLVATFFSPEVQGYYYTFTSILAFQVFAELGLSVVVTYYASHEWSKLSLDAERRVVGDAVHRSRLESLTRFAIRWYLAAGIVGGVGLAMAGYWFFSTSDHTEVHWQVPWLALCIATGVAIFSMPFAALLEGCNEVSHVYAYRLIQALSSTIASWTVIASGGGLWTPAATIAVGVCVFLYLIGRRYRRFFGSLLCAGNVNQAKIAWVDDILPMQWRIAVSWVSGFFVFSLFAPVLFRYHGPVLAGQMGMTWALASGLMGVASSWCTPKGPRFGALIAQGRYRELDAEFRGLMKITALICGAGVATIWGMLLLLNHCNYALATRFLPPSTALYLLLGTAITSLTIPASIYLRAHKREPLLRLSVISAFTTGTAVWLFGMHFGAEGVAISYLIVTLLTTPFVAAIWFSKRAEWHGARIGLRVGD